ncbi:hypothetical protein LOZ61_006709 [Ophidiomyces ophidiicola]|uniref:Uncharacterized protein n=1 Tax=Ophidiomyces ophidiicola TaxID=1387563 RepID=A0ACB8UNC6_9EURO|nr:hypothetical protein LOZ61_006709 [Ophidiomyces ophidiicola]KAI1920403.1 hypothetical protein LOZ60_006590 [Ophidiomyces ophidiicola]KAI1948120.1 hypothetical protein LOZ59_006486 [Ophidiomyces ophidiicola]KAI1962591.1 hypothetical protein LOZ56_006594 [Ophidiomyces ophidiicola]KAI1999714.1 hypothetical protein LOZ50_006546 [Ophidiomyces ophidiicola]
MAVEDPEQKEVVVAKRPEHRRRATNNSVAQTRGPPHNSSLLSERSPWMLADLRSRPSYDSESLKDLRNSTPSIPAKNITETSSRDTCGPTPDIKIRFGEIAECDVSPNIPSEVEIREKKARRALLGQELQFTSIVVDPGSTSPPTENPGDYMVSDDENDFAFCTLDPSLPVGNVVLQQRRAQTKEIINQAEALSMDNDSDNERELLYEAAQMRASMDGRRGHTKLSLTIPPAGLTPLPNLDYSLLRLGSLLVELDQSKHSLVDRLEEVRFKNCEISQREATIGVLLKDAGDFYGRLKKELITHRAE